MCKIDMFDFYGREIFSSYTLISVLDRHLKFSQNTENCDNLFGRYAFHASNYSKMARDTLIFLLQHLGFEIYLKKSVLIPVQQFDYLGLEVDSRKNDACLTKAMSGGNESTLYDLVEVD